MASTLFSLAAICSAHVMHWHCDRNPTLPLLGYL